LVVARRGELALEAPAVAARCVSFTSPSRSFSQRRRTLMPRHQAWMTDTRKFISTSLSIQLSLSSVC